MTLADAQDSAFGAQAAKDQEEVDRLESEGVSEDEMPDRPAHQEPRAGSKAAPEGESDT